MVSHTHQPPVVETPNRIDPLDEFATGWLSFLTKGTLGYAGNQKRRLILTNVLISMTAALMMIYAAIYAFIGGADLSLPILVNLTAAFLLVLTPVLHPIHPMLGALYNLAIWLSFGFFTSFSFGSGSGLHFFFLSGVASAILIMGVRQNLISMVNIFVQVGFFMYFDKFRPEPAAYIAISEAQVGILYYLSVPLAVGFIFCMVLYAFLQAHRAELMLQEEYEFSENLLARMLPQPVASELKQSPGKTIATYHEDATILFADLVGFSPRAETQSAEDLVTFLNAIFTRFDLLAERHGVEKIKTIGDAFMVAGGMPQKQPDHAERIAQLALEMMAEAKRFASEIGEDFDLRIGVATGGAVAGVIGTHKPFYDVWGTTVNLAARLETTAQPGTILISAATNADLGDAFETAPRGALELKGVGVTPVFELRG
ncbi:MAG: adenylate/guanylate cyclase domain-containing protein [Pseudomonadota bacterium]